MIEDGADAATQGTLGLQMQSLLTDMEQCVGLGASASSSASVPALHDTPEAPPAKAQAKAAKAAAKASTAAKASSPTSAESDMTWLLAGHLNLPSPQPPPPKAAAEGFAIEERTPTKKEGRGGAVALKKSTAAKKAGASEPSSGKNKSRGAPMRDAPLLVRSALKQFT